MASMAMVHGRLLINDRTDCKIRLPVWYCFFINNKNTYHKDCQKPNQAAIQKCTAEEQQAEKCNQTEYAAWLDYLICV
jgi:hypothetical protein